MGRDLTTGDSRSGGGDGSLQVQMQWAKLASSAAILPKAYRGKPADILVAIGFGASMGLSFSDSLYRINVIQGTPTMSGELIASQVRRAGHRLRIYKDEEHRSVRATIVRVDDPDFTFSATRDQAWAKDMGLAGKDNYRQQPMTMLTWRAISAVAREACPEALYGVAYTPDELGEADDDWAERREPGEQNDERTPDAGIRTPDAAGPDAVDVEVMADREQRQKISELMHQAGVRDNDQAAAALEALTGRDIASTAQITQEEAGMLLEAPELLVSRTRETLTVKGEQR